MHRSKLIANSCSADTRRAPLLGKRHDAEGDTFRDCIRLLPGRAGLGEFVAGAQDIESGPAKYLDPGNVGRRGRDDRARIQQSSRWE